MDGNWRTFDRIQELSRKREVEASEPLRLFGNAQTLVGYAAIFPGLRVHCV